MREKIILITSKLPLISGLHKCSFKDYWNAAGEIFSTLIIATTPIWLGVLGFYLGGNTFKEALVGNVSLGELLLYSTSVLAPIIYMAFSDPEGSEEPFPSKVSQGLFVVIIVAMSAYTFGQQRSGAELGSRINSVSFTLFGISVLLLYLATVYKNMRLPTGKLKHKADEREFSTAYERHRG